MKIPSRETLNLWITSRDVPVFVQFAKYGACGVISSIVLVIVAMALSATIIPAMDWSLIEGTPITDAIRQRNLIINNIIAFPISNLVAYRLNTRLVFTPGRHSKRFEFGVFTLINAFSFSIGFFGGPMLIGWFGISTFAAQFFLIVISILVNFLCRKYFVFAR